jgi:ATP-dependent Lon protease
MAGNIDVDGDRPHGRYRHLLEPLPKELQDSAFLDRVHGYLPGWELPKISRASLATGLGFVIDYFGEFLSRLRQREMRGEVHRLSFNRHLTQRDLVAVERLTSALLKLMHPDGLWTESELHALASVAVEMRQRVHDQISRVAPGEFKPKRIAFEGLVPSPATDQQCIESEAVERYDKLNHEAVVGEVTGLAAVPLGENGYLGDLVVVEASMVPGTTGLEILGARGRVLRESVKAAYQLVRSRALDFGITKSLLDENKVVVHVVHLAEELEGPSQGAAFVAAIVSAATRRPVRPGIAVTGEISLHGKMTAVKGVPQKLEAALRAGRKVVVLPRDSAELSSIPDTLLHKLEVIPVETVDELLPRVLEDQPQGLAEAL